MRYDLLLDVGNSSVKVGLAEAGEVVAAHRIAADDDLPEALAQFVGARAVRRVGVVCVVPGRVAAVRAAVAPWSRAPFAVRVDGPLPFRLAYQTPATLGLDRLAAAAAAWVRYGRPAARPVVALDAGTALTAEVVAPASGEPLGAVYLGGVIAPGLRLLARSLAEGTAQLPLVEPVATPEPIGTTTTGAIAAGLDAAFVGLAREVLRRTERRLGARPHVVLTGGDGERLVAPLADYAPAFAPHLVLEGVGALQVLATRA